MGPSVVSCRGDSCSVGRGLTLTRVPAWRSEGWEGRLPPVTGSAAWGLSRPAGPRQLRLSAAFVLPEQGRLAQPGRVCLGTAGLRVDRKHTAGGCRCEPCARDRHRGGDCSLSRWNRWEALPHHRFASFFLISGPCVSVTQTEGDLRRALPPQRGLPGPWLPELQSRPHTSRAVCSLKARHPP